MNHNTPIEAGGRPISVRGFRVDEACPVAARFVAPGRQP